MNQNTLVIDVGNTTIKWGLFVNHQLKYYYCFTKIKHVVDSILNHSLVLQNVKYPCIIGSTNDKKRKLLIETLFKSSLFKNSITIYYLKVDKLKKIGLNKAEMDEVGIDIYALICYFLNKTPCTIINFGTAITIINLTLIKHVNVLILPGIDIAIDALKHHAEKITLEKNQIETKKSIYNGKRFLIISLLTKLYYDNCNNMEYSIYVSGGGIEEYINDSSFMAELKKDFQKRDSNSLSTSVFRIHVKKNLTLLSYYDLWKKEQLKN